MFDRILGIPAHALMVHAAVVFVPLLAIAVLVYVGAPFVRHQVRWAVALLAVAGPAAAVSAKLSGDAFLRRLQASGGGTPAHLQHKDFGDATMWATIVLAAVTLLLVIVAPGRRAVARTDGGHDRHQSASRPVGVLAVNIVLSVAAVGLAVAAGYYAFRTGDSGAHMVWSGR